jgi:hypothetical protein
VSGARVTLEIRLRDDEWPGDEAFDAWARDVLAYRLGQLAAIEAARLVEWERLLEPGEPMPS